MPSKILEEEVDIGTSSFHTAPQSADSVPIHQSTGSVLPIPHTIKVASPYSAAVAATSANTSAIGSTNASTTDPAGPSSGLLKRSFSRQKLVKELINTEKVYIQSLRVLETTYIDGLMNDVDTPDYFRTFRGVIDELITSHDKFLNQIIGIYSKLQDSLEQEIYSPQFDGFRIPACESDCLQELFGLISTQTNHTENYCKYCSLYDRVLQFTRHIKMDNYRRMSLMIMNDYVVKYIDNGNNDFIDQKLDTTFISLVQVPTTRVVRYTLIIRSMLEKIKLDSGSEVVINRGQNAFNRLVAMCIKINESTGDAQEQMAQFETFKGLCDHSIKRVMGRIFLESLDWSKFGTFAGAAQVVWLEDVQIVTDYLGLFLFDTHVVICKFHQHSHLPTEVLFIIPFASVLNSFAPGEIESTRLFCRYPFHIKLLFEEAFRRYEVCVVLPSQNELEIWTSELRRRVKEQRKRISGSYGYSRLVQLQSGPGMERQFKYQNWWIETIEYYDRHHGTASLDDLHIFRVKHFVSDTNECDRDEIEQAAEEVRHMVATEIVVRHGSRVKLEKILNGIWCKTLPLYHREQSTLTHSFSTMSLRNLIRSDSTSSLFNRQTAPEGRSSVRIHRSESLRRIPTWFKNVWNGDNVVNIQTRIKKHFKPWLRK